MAEPTGMPRYPGLGAGPPSSGPGELTDAGGPGDTAPSRFSRSVKNIAWAFLAIFCFVFFTLSKLPREQINGFVQGNISSALASRGITFTAKSSDLNLLLGVSYEMKGVTLNFPPPEPPAHIDEITVSPSILPLLLGRMGGTLVVRNAGGELNISGNASKTQFSGDFSLRHFDIGSIALLRLVSGISGSAVITGHGTASADMSSLTETNADIQLDLSNITIDAQSVQGFTIPKLTVSEGKIDLSIEHGKGMLRSLRLGKPGSADDIRADISGDLLFGKKLESSTCNLKANFSFSPDLMKSFSLLGALLAPGRQPDGSFSYKLTGPLLSPNPIPIGAH